MEDSLKRVTKATETTHNHQPASKENHIAIEQGVFSKKRETFMDKQRLSVTDYVRIVMDLNALG